MSKQIELALLSLMPAHGSELPPTLVELAGSLLAQSRNRASTLKAEEEVGRHYACANIACDRLKITLDLPPIEPRPPIPPRIYKRLYTHLNNVLPNRSSTPRSTRVRTPSSKKRDLGTSPTSKSRQLPSRGTPSKEASLAQFRPSQSGPETPSKSTGHGDSSTLNESLHAWIRPTIRYMGTEIGNRRLAPTVLAGVESIVTPGGRRVDDSWVTSHVTDLVAAVYFFVIMRARAMTSGEAIDREGYVPLRKEILALLGQARNEVPIKDLDEDEAWDGWKAVKPKDFDAAVAHVTDKGWLADDWYTGIVDVVNTTRETDMDRDGDQGADDESGAQLPARRADTMLQEKYDFLSDARQSEYAAWKDRMLARIGQAMTAGGAMELDS